MASVPTSFSSLSTTAADNYPAGSDNVFPSLDDTLRVHAACLASIMANTATNDWVSPYLPNATALVYNEAGADVDARFEGDTDANLLTLDAGLDAIGVGRVPNGTAKLDIQSDAAGIVRARGGTGTNQGSGFFGTSGSDTTRFAVGQESKILGGTPGDDATLYSAGAWSVTSGGSSKRVLVGSAGNVTINAPSSGATLAMTFLASTDSMTWTDGTVSGKLGTVPSGTFFGAGSNHALYLRTNNTDQVTIAAAGNVTISAPSSGVALAVTGVAGSAAVSASTGVSVGNSANTSTTVLDHYEENTSFTPTISGAGTPSYSTQTGWATRVGNRVDFAIYLVWTGGTNGASFTIAGLPWTAKSGINVPCNIVVNALNASFTWTGAIKAHVESSGTTIAPFAEATGSTIGSLLNPNAGTKDLALSGTYFV